MKNYIQKKTYDAVNDILYISFASTKTSYCEEIDGIVILKDMDTEKVTGLTIFYPKMKKEALEMTLKEMGYDIDLASFISPL